MNAYLFVFDRNFRTDYTDLHNGIKNDTKISNWWHYLNSAYILKSSYSVTELTDSIRSYFPTGRFVVFQITRQNYNGWLSEEAWAWVYNNVDLL